MLPKIPSWIIVDDEGIKKLICSYAFLNYTDSVDWGKVTVIWWSHKIKGLHKNDFICAAKTDDLNK